jgi:hypothetical protein
MACVLWQICRFWIYYLYHCIASESWVLQPPSGVGGNHMGDGLWRTVNAIANRYPHTEITDSFLVHDICMNMSAGLQGDPCPC